MKRIPALPVIAALLAITMACERDTENPHISIASHSELDKVWNTATIQLSVEDNVGVVRVEFFVDGEFVSTINSSPWEVPWNTRNYQDGTVTISVKAYDEVGNASHEASMSLVIQNVLFSMTIEEGALWEDEDHIEILKCPVYLTGADGTLLDWALMGNGDTKVFMRPAGFDEELYDLSRGYFYHRTDDPQYFDGTLYTYMDMKPGELIIEEDDDGVGVGDYLGSSYFTSGNLYPDGLALLTYRGYNSSGNILTDTAQVSIYENYRKAYFYLRQDGFGYYTSYSALEPDRYYLINTEDLSSFMTSQTISYPKVEFDYLWAYVDAYPGQGVYDPDDETLIYRELLYPEEQLAIRLHYPTGHNGMQDFYFRTYTYTSDELRYYFSRHGPLPATYSNLNAFISDISVALPGPIQVQASGSADIQHASLYLEEGDNDLEIHPRGPVGPVLRIPQLPTEIRNQYNNPAIINSNLTDVNFYLTEHNDKDGYYPLVNHWSMMQSLESYYSPGTEVKEIRYKKYYGSEKKAAQMVHGQPGSMDRADAGHWVPMVDGPVKH